MRSRKTLFSKASSSKSSFVAYLVVIIGVLVPLKHLTQATPELSSDTRYPSLHETYCPTPKTNSSVFDASATNSIEGIESLTNISVCQRIRLKSHYCTHIYEAPASARQHKRFRVKVGGQRYE